MSQISPEGRYLAISTVDNAGLHLRLRPIDALDSHLLPGTESGDDPFWAPDGKTLGFFAAGKVKKISLAGGPPQILCDYSQGAGGNATWSKDGVILFSSVGVLYRVPAAGGVPASVLKPSAGESLRFPQFFPDGQHFLYTVTGGASEVNGIYVGALSGPGSRRRLLPDESSAEYAPPAAAGSPGHLLFVRESTFMAQPFDPKTLQLSGEVMPLAERVGVVFTGRNDFSVSNTGTLVYGAGSNLGRVNRQLVWMDSAGKALGKVSTPGLFFGFALSPDEKRVAIARVDANNTGSSDIWLQDLADDGATRLTFGPGRNTSPVWSPDGGRVAYSSTSTRGPETVIYEKSVTGTTKEEVLGKSTTVALLYDWSPDGKTLVYTQPSPKTSEDIWLLPLQGGRQPVAYWEGPGPDLQPQLSPDGRWMAYTSFEGQLPQVFVQPIPATGAKFQISTVGGWRPRWRRDGRELFYESWSGKLMAVPVKLGSGIEAGTASELFDFPAEVSVDFSAVPLSALSRWQTLPGQHAG